MSRNHPNIFHKGLHRLEPRGKMLKIQLILVMAVLLIGAAYASHASEKTYSNHNISFQIPENWSLTKDAQSANDTQIVLSNRTSTIRIDIVELPQIIWLRNSSSNDFAINSVVLGYYQKHILEQDASNINAWSGANKPNPDGIGQLTFGVGGEGKEWVLAWSKTDYGEKFIGFHALFDGKFTVVDLSEGRSEWRYYMPTPFYDLLDSFKTNSGSKSKKMYGLPVQKMAF